MKWGFGAPHWATLESVHSRSMFCTRLSMVAERIMPSDRLSTISSINVSLPTAPRNVPSYILCTVTQLLGVSADPFSGKFDLCLVRRNMLRNECYRVTRALDILEREIEINRALAQQNIVAVRPRGRRSLLEIVAICRLRKLARPHRQPDIDIESEEVGYRTNEPPINLG